MNPVAVVLLVLVYLYLAVVSVVLSVIDLRTRRLPNAIVLPSYLVIGVFLAAACVFGAPWAALGRAAVGGALLFVFYLLLRAMGSGGMGGGDVKLAGVLGIALGFIGWGALIVGALAAFVAGGIVGVILIALRVAGRNSKIPFAPFMVIGAWIGILAGETVARWYLGLLSGA